MPESPLTPKQQKTLNKASERVKSIYDTGADVVFFGTDLLGVVDFATEGAIISSGVASGAAGGVAATAAAGSLAVAGPVGFGISSTATISLGFRRLAKTASHWILLDEIEHAPQITCTCKKGSIRCPEVLGYVKKQKMKKTAKTTADILLAPIPGLMTLYVVGRASWKICRGTKGELRNAMAASLYWAARGRSSTKEGKPLAGTKGEPCPMAIAIINQLFCGNSVTKVITSTPGDIATNADGKNASSIIAEGVQRPHHQGENQKQIDKIFTKLASI